MVWLGLVRYSYSTYGYGLELLLRHCADGPTVMLTTCRAPFSLCPHVVSPLLIVQSLPLAPLPVSRNIVSLCAHLANRQDELRIMDRGEELEGTPRDTTVLAQNLY